MNFKLSLFFIIAFALTSVGFAQNKLLIGKPGNPASYVFVEGEMLRFRLKGEKYWNKAYIQGLYEDRIRFHYNVILIDEIEYIDVRDRGKGGFLHILSWVSTRGGAGFATIAQINKTFVADEPGLEKTALVIGGSIFSGGIILSLFKRRKVKLGGRYRLKVDEM
ncbi:hypothetical protein JMN32_12880 [Fulvivirga sp. 29W222]|uniref:Uncharacterized protein n=1 Tax=Fulvivirga marina TaxID=2494733 RepID=A0A937FWA4_9BACT|nr:hypothetical protein [Fulvivirga marina]MBL6447209.1 hypothetical protein [Fulvivirga marina]